MTVRVVKSWIMKKYSELILTFILNLYIYDKSPITLVDYMYMVKYINIHYISYNIHLLKFKV